MSYKAEERVVNIKNTSFKRPSEGTITERLQDPDEYRKKLQGYVEVENIDHVPERTHVRYFVYDTTRHKWLFRTGGVIRLKHQDYVILSNGRVSWSVQKEKHDKDTGDVWETKFFKILSKQALAEIALDQQQKEIEQLRQENEALRQQVYALHRH